MDFIKIFDRINIDDNKSKEPKANKYKHIRNNSLKILTLTSDKNMKTQTIKSVKFEYFPGSSKNITNDNKRFDKSPNANLSPKHLTKKVHIRNNSDFTAKKTFKKPLFPKN